MEERKQIKMDTERGLYIPIKSLLVQKEKQILNHEDQGSCLVSLTRLYILIGTEISHTIIG